MSVDQHPVPPFEAVTEPHKQPHPDPDLLPEATSQPGGFLEDALAGRTRHLDAPAASQWNLSKDEPSRCGHCGTVRESDWAFCGACGKDLPEPAPADPGARSTTRRGMPPKPGAEPMPFVNEVADEVHLDRLQQVTSSAGSRQPPAAGRVATLTVPDRLDQRGDTDPPVGHVVPRRGRGKKVVAIFAVVMLILAIGAAGCTGWVKLNHSQERLAATRNTLHTTKAQLAFANDTLDTTRDQLDSAESDLTDSKDEVDALQSKLEHTQGSLNHAQNRLDLQAGQIDTLQSCLGGVASALSDLANGYLDLALSDLQAVETDCNEAESML